MATFEEIWGSAPQTSVIAVPDSNDLIIDNAEDMDYESTATEVFSQFADPSKLVDAESALMPSLDDSAFIDPIHDPSEPPDLEQKDTQLQLKLNKFESKVKTGANASLSLAGKGIAVMGEVFTRGNILLSQSPVTQTGLGIASQITDKFNAGLQKASQWYAMNAAFGKMPKEEAKNYVDNLIKRGSPTPVREVLVNMASLTQPFEATKASIDNPSVKSALTTPIDESVKDTLASHDSFGDKLGDAYYKVLTGEDPSDAWRGLVDFSFETIITAPVSTVKVVKGAKDATRKAGEIAKIFPKKPLTTSEFKALKKFYSRHGATKMASDPSMARAELKRLTGLSKYSTDAKLQANLIGKSDRAKEVLESALNRKFREAVEIPREQVEAGKTVLDSILSDIDPATKVANIQKKASKSRKFRKATNARQGGTGKKAALKARWALKGDDFVHDFEVNLDFVTPEMEDLMFDVINALPEWDAQSATTGLLKILDKKLPSRSEVIMLEKAFGAGTMAKIEALANRPIDVIDTVTDIANIPRSIQTAFDMGAPMRNGNFGLKAGYADEWGGAFVAMMKAGAGQKYADDIERLGTLGARGALYKEMGLELTSLSKFAKLSQREEAFLSTFAERIPVLGRGIKWSERTHTAFLNQFRMNLADSITSTWLREGRKLSPKDLKALGEHINHISGRGDVKSANRALKAMFGVTGKEIKDVHLPTTASIAMYSPRFFLSKIQVHTDLLTTNSGLVRKLVARDLRNYYYTNMQFLRMAKMGEKPFGWKVEDDPTSGDFGKITTIENGTKVSYDVWGPIAPVMKFVSRIESGTSKSTVTDEVRDISKSDVTMRFLRSQASPAVGLAIDIKTGSTFLGDSVDLKSAAGLRKIASESLIPLAPSDIIDSFRYDKSGFFSNVVSTTSFFGQGVLTYETSPYQKAHEKKNALSNDLFGKDMAELSATEEMMLLTAASRDPEILQLEKQGMFELSDDFGETTSKQQRVSEKQVLDMVNANAKNMLNGTATGIRNISQMIRPIKGHRLKLNRDQFTRYKELIAVNINTMLGEFDRGLPADMNLLYVTGEQVEKVVSRAVKVSQTQVLAEILRDERNRDLDEK
jgi:hypothetical protein